ncbi:hypothetical protein KA005_24465, partial [bacterium]|nr:hypothetical protein [bacterium]
SAGTTDDILIYLTNELDEIFWAAGTDVPVDTTPGYAPGCMFIDRDVVAGTVKNYLNVGTALLCEFSIITVA